MLRIKAAARRDGELSKRVASTATKRRGRRLRRSALTKNILLLFFGTSCDVAGAQRVLENRFLTVLRSSFCIAESNGPI
jgi:hypothetical protein